MTGTASKFSWLNTIKTFLVLVEKTETLRGEVKAKTRGNQNSHPLLSPKPVLLSPEHAPEVRMRLSTQI